MTLTSDNDPICVDFVDPAAHGLPGRLGLALAPGKSIRGLTADWDRDLGKDLARLREHYRTDVLVTLIEEFEMEDAGIPLLRPEAQRAGMKSIWFPIPDVSTPRTPPIRSRSCGRSPGTSLPARPSSCTAWVVAAAQGPSRRACSPPAASTRRGRSRWCERRGPRRWRRQPRRRS
jgi:hypothetical protein